MIEAFSYSGAVTTNCGSGLQRHKDARGDLAYIDGWVSTPYGYVVVYAKPRGPRSKPYVSLRFIWRGRVYTRNGNQRSGPSVRGLTALAGRLAQEIAA